MQKLHKTECYKLKVFERFCPYLRKFSFSFLAETRYQVNVTVA